jgi:ribosomal protein S18 acetylase RimI-like enzyme
MTKIGFMENIQVMKLSPDEWQLFKQFRLESLLVEPQAFGSSYAEVIQRSDSHWQERLVKAQAGEKSWLLFAKENTRMIGMIGAYCTEEGDVVEIVSPYVTKEKRKLGVATALMTALLAEIAKRDSIRKVTLGVNAGQTAAVALYLRFGFQMVGEKTAVFGDGNAHTSYIMERELGNKS